MNHPAYLIIGPQEEAVAKAKVFMKEAFCSNGGCENCHACKLVSTGKHHNVRWLAPENQYKVEQLQVVFDTIRYALEPNEHFFFVFERADQLSSATANSLLKSLEEPPAGYHFILLAPWSEGILPTVASRCMLFTCSGDVAQEHPLIMFFKRSRPDMAEFAKELERIKPQDKEMFDIFDAVYGYILDQYKKAEPGEDKKRWENLLVRLDFLKNYPPMPGSGKIFLKNLFLQYFY